jgi:hypothetical protein
MRADRIDTVDQQLEYETLCAELTGAGVPELLGRIHAAHVSIDGSAKLVHLSAVGALAAQHADAWFVEDEWNAQRYWKLACRLAGQLHEAMEWGVDFETIVSVADVSVARMTAALTPDPRVVRYHRCRLAANALGLAGIPTQLVKLADLQHDCFLLAGMDDERFTPPVVERVVDWLDEANEALRSMTALAAGDIHDQLLDLRSKLKTIHERANRACGRPSGRRRR